MQDRTPAVLVLDDGRSGAAVALAALMRWTGVLVADRTPDPQFSQVVLSSAWPEPPPGTGNRHARRKWMATYGKR